MLKRIFVLAVAVTGLMATGCGVDSPPPAPQAGQDQATQSEALTPYGIWFCRKDCTIVASPTYGSYCHAACQAKYGLNCNFSASGETGCD